MNLTGVSAHGAALAETLAVLLVRHGYLDSQPETIDGLLNAALAAKPERADAFVLIQEGGSSSELYVHSHATAESAEDARVDCAFNGAYRTSPVLPVSGALAQTPGFYAALESIIALANNLDLVDTSALE